MKMWIARHETQELWLFIEKPYLFEEADGCKYWVLDNGMVYPFSSIILDADSYPEVTFENSPMEVELVIKK